MDAPREVLDIPAEFAPVASAFAGCRDVTTERGWRSGGVTLKAGGKIFAMLVEGKFVAKLPRDRVRELVRERVGAPFDPRGDGRVMNEWVVIESHRSRWPSVAREAYAFVVSRKRRGAR
jgi:hypothetical protein